MTRDPFKGTINVDIRDSAREAKAMLVRE